MLLNYGYFLLSLCFAICLFGSFASFISALFRHRNLLSSSRIATTCALALSLFAGFILVYLLVTHEYRAAYVYKNSSNDLPFHFLISAFWSSLEGSHFIWTIIMASLSTIAVWTVNASNKHLLPYINGTLLLILSWMFFEAITSSNPFQEMRPIASNGLGMNELLQNPYMMIHPPILFSGYSASAVPFAYTVAALFYGDITTQWLPTVRRWTLLAWTLLTAGIFLGGKWAYVELGWAGYWAWDPVENSSLMPWIFLTALLHSLLVQSHIGHLKRLSLLLSALAFFFCFFGTFITRSGLMSSVHSFAESRVGPDYLIFLTAILIFTIVLYIIRAPSILPSNASKEWKLSRESLLVCAQFIFAIFAMIVFVGTIYPILSEVITNQRFNVQAPYFNSFAPYIGFLTIMTMTFGTLFRYKKAGLRRWRNKALAATLLAIPATIAFAYWGNIFSSRGFRLLIQLVGTWICFWAALCMTFEAFSTGNKRSRPGPSKKPLEDRSFSNFGTYLAHIGAIIAVLGFLGNYRGLETTSHLERGQSAELFGYEFKFREMNITKDHNATLFQAALDVSRNGQHIETLLPAKAKYPTKPELLNEVSLVSSFWYDIYTVISDFDQKSGQHVTITININPTVKLVWLSGILLVLGGMVSLIGVIKQTNRREKEICVV